MQQSSYQIDIDFAIEFYIKIDAKFDLQINVDVITRLLYQIRP